jgi:hypothetical protein
MSRSGPATQPIEALPLTQNSRPIFGTGLARSGGGLYSSILSTHPQMMVAICPYLELFRSYRNAVFREQGPGARETVPPKAPLQDYYFTDERIRLLDAILSSDLNTPFAPDEWPEFERVSRARGELEAADLAKHFGALRGATYREMFANALRIIGDARNASARTWVGFHEAWAIDFYPALARAFPEARFLIMFRDLRATVNSMQGVRRIDPTQVVQVMSYARHWRKYAALALQYSADPLFAGRLLITSHDRILTDTERSVRELCAFFEVPYDERMIDSRNFVDYTTQATWTGNSSFEDKTEGISAHRATRWKDKLTPDVVDVVEWLAGPELTMMGYKPITQYAHDCVPSDGIIRYISAESDGPSNWRSDLGDPVQDISLEMFRKRLIRAPEDLIDEDASRRLFLFDSVRERLSSQRPAFDLGPRS